MTTIAYHFNPATAQKAFAALGPVEVVSGANSTAFAQAAKARSPLGAPTTLAGFSAGCAAIKEHLRLGGNNNIEGLAILDGAHTQMAAVSAAVGSPVWEQNLGMWKQVFAQAKAGGGYRVCWTSSRIVTEPAYASTRATLQALCDAYTSLGQLPASGILKWGSMRLVLTDGDDGSEHIMHQQKLAAVAAAFLADGVEPRLPTPDAPPGPAGHGKPPEPSPARAGVWPWLLALLGLGTLANERRKNVK